MKNPADAGESKADGRNRQKATPAVEPGWREGPATSDPFPAYHQIPVAGCDQQVPLRILLDFGLVRSKNEFRVFR